MGVDWCSREDYNHLSEAYKHLIERIRTSQRACGSHDIRRADTLPSGRKLPCARLHSARAHCAPL